ncbi:hypothetical protein LCGC14_2354680, partial [marine sediment metagenome]
MAMAATVTNHNDNNDPGTLRTVLNNAGAGDTINFNLPGDLD